MTETKQKSDPRRAELSDEVLESVDAGHKKSIEAVRKFVDQVVLPDQAQRKTVVDAALNLADELATAHHERFRRVLRSAGEAMSKQ
jgi:hypothetical protein